MITPSLQLTFQPANPPVPWRERALAAAKTYIRGWRGVSMTGEDVRFHVTDTVGVPSHPNAWGGLVRALVKDGFLRGTGIHVPMSDPRSHGRQTPLYTAVNA